MIHPEPTGAGLARGLRQFFLNFYQEVSIFASSVAARPTAPSSKAAWMATSRYKGESNHIDIMTSAEYYKNEVVNNKKRLQAIDELRENEKKQDELRTHCDEVFKLEEEMNFIKSDGTKLIIKERPCETVWAIEEEIKQDNTAAIIDYNKGNATVQAIIAWKQQEIITKALRYAFEREYEFMEDKKWWALDENNRYYR